MSCTKKKNATESPTCAATDRRTFLGVSAAIAAGGVLSSCSAEWREAFFRKRFKELNREERERILVRLTKKNQRTFGKPFAVTGEPAHPGVSFAYGLDLSRCVGCRKCVYACVSENNQSRDPQVHWIRVLEMEKEAGIDLFDSTPYYNSPTVPREGHFYMPVSCQQCRRPQCTTVCPVGATWKEPDGIVVIDYDWCIGCRYCMVACPYGARHFNWSRPKIPKDEVNRSTHYLGNRPRYRGVVEKCTFCIQRVRKPEGRYPACVEICPVGARKFGDLKDSKSEIRELIRHKRVFILKEELNTKPRFFYFYGV